MMRWSLLSCMMVCLTLHNSSELDAVPRFRQTELAEAIAKRVEHLEAPETEAVVALLPALGPIGRDILVSSAHSPFAKHSMQAKVLLIEMAASDPKVAKIVERNPKWVEMVAAWLAPKEEEPGPQMMPGLEEIVKLHPMQQADLPAEAWLAVPAIRAAVDKAARAKYPVDGRFVELIVGGTAHHALTTGDTAHPPAPEEVVRRVVERLENMTSEDASPMHCHEIQHLPGGRCPPYFTSVSGRCGCLRCQLGEPFYRLPEKRAVTT